MFKRFRDTNLRAKGYLASAGVVVVLAIMVGWATLTIETIRGELGQVTDHTIPLITVLNETEKALLDAHMQLYRTISWMTNGVSGDAMEAQVAETWAAIGDVEALVASEQETGGNPIVAAAPDLFLEYVTSVKDALDMAVLDPSLATMVVMAANDSFAEAFALTEEMRATNAAKTAARSGEVTEMTRRSVLIFVGIAVAAIVLALVFTTTIFGAIARPIVAMTRSMLRLAEDDLDIELPDTTGGEIGQMAAAMQVFRKNAIERRDLEAQERTAREAQLETERKAMEDRARLADEQAARDQVERERVEQAARRAQRLQEALTRVVSAAEQGDLTVRIDETFEDPAQIEVARTVNSLVRTIENSLSYTMHFLGALADGDLTARVDGQFQGAFEQLKTDANTAAERLCEAVAEIIARASDVSADADSISQSANGLAIRTETAAASLEETATALEQMSTSVKSASNNASSANDLVGNALAQASESNAIVAETVAAINQIEAVSSEISKTVSIIDDIAFQTNLLALNAGVEAARAGEAGRGFAVVAAEVRELAQRASTSAKEIGAMISRSEVEVRKGVELVGRTGDALRQMGQAVEEISSRVSEISSSAEEQSNGIGDINQAVGSLDQATQQNAAMFEETNAASIGLSSSARQMVETMCRFRVTVPAPGESEQGVQAAE